MSVRKIDLTDYCPKDIVRILLEKDKYTYKEYEGYSPGNLDTIPKELKRYLIKVAVDCYQSGANRVVQQINRKEDDKARKAQDRAIKKIMSMNLDDDIE